jgi:hypothetical protein
MDGKAKQFLLIGKANRISVTISSAPRCSLRSTRSIQRAIHNQLEIESEKSVLQFIRPHVMQWTSVATEMTETRVVMTTPLNAIVAKKNVLAALLSAKGNDFSLKIWPLGILWPWIQM